MYDVIKPMIRKINLFIALSAEEKRLFVEAYYLLGHMRVLIAIVSFKRLTRSLIHSHTHIDQAKQAEGQLDTAKRIGEIITKAANNTPWESACLVQVLTAQKMLEKRKIHGVFYLGAKKSGPDKEKLEAHAWSQCNDLIITGGQGHESFSVLSVYGWESK